MFFFVWAPTGRGNDLETIAEGELVHDDARHLYLHRSEHPTRGKQLGEFVGGLAGTAVVASEIRADEELPRLLATGQPPTDDLAKIFDRTFGQAVCTGNDPLKMFFRQRRPSGQGAGGDPDFPAVTG